jgi:hypothetical protein
MTVDVRAEVLDQLEWHWVNQLRPRLEGLSDEECWWEPVAGCWSIRPRADARGAASAGAGEFVIEWQMPVPSPPPVTTIAWRLGHVAIGCFGARASAHFGDGTLTYDTVDWPATADGMLALLDEQHAAWVRGLRSFGDADFGRPVGPAEGPFAERTYLALALHLNREAIHHGAEVALLRDLYRAHFASERGEQRE